MFRPKSLGLVSLYLVKINRIENSLCYQRLRKPQSRTIPLSDSRVSRAAAWVRIRVVQFKQGDNIKTCMVT